MGIESVETAKHARTFWKQAKLHKQMLLELKGRFNYIRKYTQLVHARMGKAKGHELLRKRSISSLCPAAADWPFS